MKKALCLFLVVLTLFSLLTVFAGAESVTAPRVMQELATLKIDGKAFSESDFPLDSTDEKLYIIAAAERNFRTVTYSPGYELYFYIYNPSGKEFKEDVRNSIQIGLNDECTEYKFYGAKIHSRSNDNRFLLLGVTTSAYYASSALLFGQQKDAARRIYNVVQVRLVTEGDLESFTLNRVFFFEGYDYNKTLKCFWQELGALEVTLHSTSWISPNAGYKADGKTEATIYDHYEINSVYFSIPRELYNQYDYLKSIRAEYDAARLTPIIVTRPGDFDEATKNAILAGTTIWKDNNNDGDNDLGLDVMDLYWQYYTDTFWTELAAWLYSESDHTRDLADAGLLWIDRSVNLQNFLAYYFEVLPEGFDYTDGAQFFKAVVAAEDLEAYFEERYNDPKYDSSKLYSEIQHKVMDYHSRDFDDEAIWSMSGYNDMLEATGGFKKWWKKLTIENDSYTWLDFATKANHIDVYLDPSEYANVSSASYQKVADELFIGVNDVENFSKFCAEAAQSDEVVVLLRFGFSDYRFQVVEDVWEGALGVGAKVGVAIEKWAYMDFSLAHLVFYNDGADIVVPVSSNVVDSFGDLDAGGDSGINGPADIVDDFKDSWKDFTSDVSDFWGSMTKVLAWVGVGVAVLVVLFIVLRFIKPKDKIELVLPDGTNPKRRKRRK